MELTRRSFVEGAGAAAAGIAAVSASAVAEEVAEEAEVFPWGNEAPVIDEADVEEELECDVVIVGVGLAGAAATLGAAEAGAASVITFDKTEEGHSATGNQTAVINGIQEKWGRAGIYDIAEICNHEINECCGWPKHAIWFKWANGIGDTFNWCLDTLGDYEILDNGNVGMGFEGNYVAPMAYPLPEGFHPESEYNTTYATSVAWSSGNWVPAALERAGEICDLKTYGSHRVEQLIVEDGRVCGCYAYNYETAKYKKVRANKGVVLSCGDYTGDKAMYKYYLPEQYANGVTLMYNTRDPEGNAANTGEAIKMGTWIGARVDQHHAVNGHHMGHSMTGGIGSMGIAPFMRVNKFGKRFMNEDQPGQQTENQMELQKDFGCFMIWDADWCSEVDSFAPTHGSVYHFLQEGETGEGKSQADLDDSVASGETFKADTIEDLLSQLDAVYGLDVETAKASIERYNKLAHNGNDEDFGKLASRLFPIEKAPFYATTMGLASMLSSTSGLESDEECHTFDQDRNIIPGLYCAGNSQGNRFNIQYPIAMEGVATSMCIFYGRVAGENVVKGA